MKKIINIIAREILDSRGNPTVECDMILDDDTPLGIDINVADGSGFPHSGHRLDGVTAEHTLPPMAQARARVKKWLSGMFPRPLPYRTVVRLHSLYPPNIVVALK